LAEQKNRAERIGGNGHSTDDWEHSQIMSAYCKLYWAAET
jgi:hypothetical protein